MCIERIFVFERRLDRFRPCGKPCPSPGNSKQNMGTCRLASAAAMSLVWAWRDDFIIQALEEY